ncbi:MAG: PorP/SprF family type IX secretion system membrane protein [Cyclobacteriaceae bacterium]
MRALLIILVMISGFGALCQDGPVFRQFFANQGIYNPSLTGINNAFDVSLIHRRQWISFNNGPVATGFLFQHSGKKRVNFGVSIIGQESVNLTNVDSRFAIAYVVPLSKEVKLRLGLSGGFVSERLNLNGVDYGNDPAIIRAAEGRTEPSGAAGIAFEFRNLQVGFSLPDLLPGDEDLNQLLNRSRPSAFYNQWYSLFYSFESGNLKLKVTPRFIFRTVKDLRGNWEVGSNFTFNEWFFIGAAYNQGIGASLYSGFKAAGKIEIGYCWETGWGAANSFGASHEFRITVPITKE